MVPSGKSRRDDTLPSGRRVELELSELDRNTIVGGLLTQHTLYDAVPVARCQAFEESVGLVDGTLGLDTNLALGVGHARTQGRRQVDE